MNQNFSREDFVNQNEIPVSLELVVNPKYAEIPTLAKILYSVLKYRIKLSARNRNKFEDENGLFIYFKQTEIAEIFGANVSTIKRWFKILRDNDLIEVVQQGLGKPSKIYVRNLPVLENDTPVVSEIGSEGSHDEYPKGLTTDTLGVSNCIPSYSENEEMRSKKENEERESQRNTTFEPTFDEVRYFVRQSGWSWDARTFFDYYSARGWRLNGTPIHDWRALCRVWNRREQEIAIRNGKRTSGDARTLDEKWGVVSYGSDEWEERYGNGKRGNRKENHGAFPEELPF